MTFAERKLQYLDARIRITSAGREPVVADVIRVNPTTLTARNLKTGREFRYHEQERFSVEKGIVTTVVGRALRTGGGPDGAIYFSACTVLRVKKVRHGTMTFGSGETEMTHMTVETEPCGTPLFKEDETRAGICRSCAGGWNVDANRFVDDAERRRAVEADVLPRP